MGRQGQVAIFVLVGLIFVIAIILALYVINQKKIETTTTEDEQLRLQQNPELAAERARMQQRVDECLALVTRGVLDEAKMYGVQACSLEAAETALAEEVSGTFSDCFFRFNTIDKLAITDEALPRATVLLGNDRVIVTAAYSVRGEFDGEAYTLNEYTATIDESPRDAIAYAIALSCYGVTATSDSPTGTTGTSGGLNTPLPPGIPDIDVNALFDAECYYDAYAYEDEGIYTDLLLLPDGTRVVYVYDYNHLDTKDAPTMSKATLAPCVPST